MSATQPRSESEETPVFRRARPDDAVEMALATFVSGERVDMQSLAARLDVSPATLYRWFGSRAQLLDRAFALMSLDFAAEARAAARGEGDERVCDYARHIMVSAAGFEAMRAFVGREPQLALRLLLGKDGSVHRVVTEQTAEVVAETRSPEEAHAIDAHVHMIVQVATALVWATFMIGDAPEIDSAVELIRMVLASSRTDA
jgi:AcrR family transcriptional regulator